MNKTIRNNNRSKIMEGIGYRVIYRKKYGKCNIYYDCDKNPLNEGDTVRSICQPWYHGTIFRLKGKWVWIDVGGKIQRKAKYNVRLEMTIITI